MFDPILVVYAQEQWHDTARIVGSREALQALRDALMVALDGNLYKPIRTEVSAPDGEGFYIEVEMVSDEDAPYLPDGYTSPDAHRAVKGDLK